MTDHTAEKDGTPGPCYICKRDPAAGFASMWTEVEGERWYCHGDDDEDAATCYERGSWARSEANATHDIATGNVVRFDIPEDALAWLRSPIIPPGLPRAHE